MKKVANILLIMLLTYNICFSQSVSNTKLKKYDGKYKIEYKGKNFDVNNQVITVKPNSRENEKYDNYDVISKNKLGFMNIAVPFNVDLQDYAKKLIMSEKFEFIRYNSIGKYSEYIPNDALKTNTNQWYLDMIKMYSAWDFTTGNSNVIVALIDSGVDWEHEDIGMGTDGYQNILMTGWNYATNSNDVKTAYFHGTFAAGIIAAKTNNGKGIAGIAGGNGSGGIKILPYCVGVFAPQSEYIADAIIDAVDKGARIIDLNIELVVAFGETYPDIDAAIQYAVDNDVVLISAVGNNPSNNPVFDYISYPASNPNVIAVGATDQNSVRASFSCYTNTFGGEVNIVAPGKDIYSTTLDNGYTTSSGTSFSNPQVAAVAALMLSVNPSLTSQEIRTIIDTTATKIGKDEGTYTYSTDNSDGWNEEVGYGLINACKAVAAAAGTTCGGGTNTITYSETICHSESGSFSVDALEATAAGNYANCKWYLGSMEEENLKQTGGNTFPLSEHLEDLDPLPSVVHVYCELPDRIYHWNISINEVDALAFEYFISLPDITVSTNKKFASMFLNIDDLEQDILLPCAEITIDNAEDIAESFEEQPEVIIDDNNDKKLQFKLKEDACYATINLRLNCNTNCSETFPLHVYNVKPEIKVASGCDAGSVRINNTTCADNTMKFVVKDKTTGDILGENDNANSEFDISDAGEYIIEYYNANDPDKPIYSRDIVVNAGDMQAMGITEDDFDVANNTTSEPCTYSISLKSGSSINLSQYAFTGMREIWKDDKWTAETEYAPLTPSGNIIVSGSYCGTADRQYKMTVAKNSNVDGVPHTKACELTFSFPQCQCDPCDDLADGVQTGKMNNGSAVYDATRQQPKQFTGYRTPECHFALKIPMPSGFSYSSAVYTRDGDAIQVPGNISTGNNTFELTNITIPTPCSSTIFLGWYGTTRDTVSVQFVNNETGETCEIQQVFICGCDNNSDPAPPPVTSIKVCNVLGSIGGGASSSSANASSTSATGGYQPAAPSPVVITGNNFCAEYNITIPSGGQPPAKPIFFKTYDINGNLKDNVWTVSPGGQLQGQFSVNISTYPAGIYYLVAELEGQTTGSMQFTKR